MTTTTEIEALWREVALAAPAPTSDPFLDDFLPSWKRRDEFIERYAWAVPTIEAIAMIAGFLILRSTEIA